MNVLHIRLYKNKCRYDPNVYEIDILSYTVMPTFSYLTKRMLHAQWSNMSCRVIVMKMTL